MKIIASSLFLISSVLAINPAMFAFKVTMNVGKGLIKWKAAKNSKIDPSRYTKHQAQSLDTDILRLNQPLNYITIEEKLQKDFAAELNSLTKVRWFTSAPGVEAYKSLVGKTILLNTSELAAANLMFALTDKCKLEAESEENACNSLAAELASRIMARVKGIEDLNGSSDKQRRPVPSLWSDHVKSVTSTLLEHKDKLSTEDAATLTALHESVKTPDF